MMDVAGVRDCIGAKRFVWIDDAFNDTPRSLGRMLVENVEVTLRCGFEAIEGIMEGIEADPAAVHDDVVQHLAALGAPGLKDVKRRFFEERVAMALSGREFSDAAVAAICESLGIGDADRHPFDEGIAAVKTLCGGQDDSDVGYIVDLNDARSDDRRGLEILRILAESKSRGIAFILTHDTEVSGEAAKEEELARALAGEAAEIDVPVCVIAKDRLFDKTDVAAVQQPLVVALKRAGLRRCMHEVLRRAKGHMHREFAQAAGNLLRIPPEALDAFVVERSYNEGMSELHVVERALTAHVSRSMRHLFGTDREMLAQADVMRRLRDVPLEGAAPLADDRLEAFRQAEIWESDELINAGFAPLACGDVFECDMVELPPGMKKRRYLLLGQPCDIAIRPDKDRDQEATFLVPMTERPVEAVEEKDKPKTTSFPFTIAGEIWTCNLRNATMARLAVLDLASFRTDGMVRVDAGHSMPAGLLPGQQRIYTGRTKAADRALAAKPAPAKTGENPGVDPDLQLTLSREGDFKRIHHGGFEPAKEHRPDRMTWRLRRIGRVQMPYAAAMLEALTGSMSRRAFDLDFAKATPAPAAGKPTPVESATAPTPVVDDGAGPSAVDAPGTVSAAARAPVEGATPPASPPDGTQ